MTSLAKVFPVGPEAPTFTWGEGNLADVDESNFHAWLSLALKKHGGVWVRDLPATVYHTVRAMSASGRERLIRSPLHFLRTPEKEPSPAMREGTALHMAVLEPERFEETYVVLGQCAARKADGSRCTNSGKYYRGGGKSYCGVRGHDPEDGAPMDPGIETIHPESRARILGARDAVLDHPEAGVFFRGVGWSEVSGFWVDEATKVIGKIRLDREPRKAVVHCDLKGTDDARPHGFHRRAAQLGYHRKAAWYRRGMAALGKPAIGSAFVVVEWGVKRKDEWEEGDPTGPHGVMVYVLSEGQLVVLGSHIDGDLLRFRQCIDTGEWPGYPGGMVDLFMADWAMAEGYSPPDDDSDEDELPA